MVVRVSSSRKPLFKFANYLMIGQARTRPLQFSTDQLVSDRVRARVRAPFRTGREREREREKERERERERERAQRYSRSRDVIALWLRWGGTFSQRWRSIRQKSRASASADQSRRYLCFIWNAQDACNRSSRSLLPFDSCYPPRRLK